MVSARMSILICLLYAASSITLSMINKVRFIVATVLSKFDFQCPFFLIGFQLCVTLTVCVILKSLHPSRRPCDVPVFDWVVYRRSIPMACTFVLNVAAGFVALRLVNIPVFLCIRRTSVMFVMIAEFVVLGKVASKKTQLATAVIALGALVAGGETLTANYIGYVFVVLNNLLTAGQLTLTRRFSDRTGVTAFGLMFYTGLTALPLSFTFGVLFGEGSTLMNYEYLTLPSFYAALALSCSVGVVLAYSLVLCSTVNSPLATSVTGNLKDIIGTSLGALLFGDYTPTALSLTGLGISFCGALWFSQIRMKAALAKAAADRAEEAEAGRRTKDSRSAVTPINASAYGGFGASTAVGGSSGNKPVGTPTSTDSSEANRLLPAASPEPLDVNIFGHTGHTLDSGPGSARIGNNRRRTHTAHGEELDLQHGGAGAPSSALDQDAETTGTDSTAVHIA